MKKFSFTVEGGLGDFILKYLGSPGDRLASLLKVCEVELRMSDSQKAGQQLFHGNPFFKKATLITVPPGMRSGLSNDISRIHNLETYPKTPVPLWLDEKEDAIFRGLKRPYAVLHPYASNQVRNLSAAFDVPALAQWVADYSGVRLLVLGQEEFGYSSSNVTCINSSPRLACKIVEHATFFIGTHSSMQCAATVYNIPGFCMGPGSILFHDFSAPNSYLRYLQPLFVNGSVFMFFSEASHFKTFFRHFLLQATSLTPNSDPQLARQHLALTDRVLLESIAL